jgi:hypothetical protein
VKAQRQRETGDRTGDCHQEFRFRIGRLVVHLGDAAEDEQGDALDLQAVAAGHQRVRQLVEDNGSEQSDRPDDCHP